MVQVISKVLCFALLVGLGSLLVRAISYSYDDIFLLFPVLLALVVIMLLYGKSYHVIIKNIFRNNESNYKFRDNHFILDCGAVLSRNDISSIVLKDKHLPIAVVCTKDGKELSLECASNFAGFVLNLELWSKITVDDKDENEAFKKFSFDYYLIRLLF